MTPRRALASGASFILVGALSLVMAASASARPATTRVDLCLRPDPIPAAALAVAARSGCPLVGRMVTDGRVSVAVPPPGMTVGGDGVGRHGDVRGLTVTNTGTTVRVVGAGDGGGGDALARTGSTAACRDRTFHLEHHKWFWSLRYHINLAKMPARFAKRTVVRQIQAANENMRKGVNTCGKPRLRTPLSHYLGRTSKRPDIDPSGPSCKLPGNTTNVVGFGNLPAGLLGWTCYWYDANGRMAGVDMLLDNGPDMTTRLPADCVNEWDFEGTVTHEWGHAYGLAHTGPGHPNLTMQHALKPCSTYARTLGLGDWLGMNKMYGHRR